MENIKLTMKVMHFIHWNRSGITTLVKNIASYGSGKFRIGVLLFEGGNHFHEEFMQVRTKKQLYGFKNLFKSILVAKRFYANFQPYIVHAHSFTPLVISYLLFKESVIIFHAHNFYTYYTSRDIKSVLKRHLLIYILKRNDIHVCTVNNKAELFFTHHSIQAKTLLNGLPDIGTHRESLDKVSHNFRFYTVSRLERDKNITYAIEIFEKLNRLGIKFRFDIYGDGGEYDILYKMILDKNLSHCIFLKGYIKTPENLPCLYDFYLSTAIIEGIGLSMIDALRSRIPIIMTPKGELARILKDNESAFFIDFDKDKAVEKIIDITGRDGKDLECIQSGGRTIYEKHFTMDLFVRNLSDIYNTNCC